MRVHITKLYGLGGTAGKAQSMVADIAKNCLQYNELGIYCYRAVESSEMLRARLDGIIASVDHGDIIIFQHPMWGGIDFEEALLRHLGAYKGLKKIFFIHDIEPLMFGVDSILDRYISLYNQSDLIILPSQKMADFLCAKGLSVKKIVIQRMWDNLVSIDTTITPQFKKVIHFAGDINAPKFSFTKEWKYDAVKLVVTQNGGDWTKGKNVECIGWHNNETLLADIFRRYGGFGLLWTEDPIWEKYIRLNACMKLSTYLVAGLPVVVPVDVPEAETIIKKGLGIAVNSLDEAVDRIEHMSEEEYRKMTENVRLFSYLLKEGYFTRKVLTDAVFYLLND